MELYIHALNQKTFFSAHIHAIASKRLFRPQLPQTTNRRGPGHY
ncbi:hypothetical protein FOPG_19084 [Fusarium oxysporum f. sp. conglutinans race 2 54008]|uniref:Uncharacterized protein n=1 Tax=Fusarium oxysporum f. sp. conglutinans race 2 54008 TaxID=1089457 RepID=X0GM01_FUSOX|nr:hypothetical protein FOPG_19084 [Fusarium oxysporum f. sp. conglutinans race 2 54008]